MIKQFKISIIVPVYNGEKYLARCLDSLINQTYKMIEILIIDDGSTDSSGKISDHYAETHNNIKVFHTKNNGVSIARNLGIKEAIGDYITFVDSDDWVDNEYYQKMAMHDADIIVSGLQFDLNSKEYIRFTNKIGEYNNITAIEMFLTGDLDVHVVNKLFKKTIVENVLFEPEIHVSEDRLFLCKTLINASRVRVINDGYYHYYQNNKSVMHEKLSEKDFENIKVALEISSKLNGYSNKFSKLCYCYNILAECRLCEKIYCSGNMAKYESTYKKYIRDIKEFNLKENKKELSKKHYFAILLMKVHPKLYAIVKKNEKLKFG